LTPLLRHRRSRLQPAFGQINPSKRPFGALGLTELTSRGTWRLSSRRKLRPVKATAIRALSWLPTDFPFRSPSSGCTLHFTRLVGRVSPPSPSGPSAQTTAMTPATLRWRA